MTSFMRLLRSTAQKHGLCVMVGIIPSCVCFASAPPFGLRAELKWRSRTDKRDPRTDVHTGTE